SAIEPCHVLDRVDDRELVRDRRMNLGAEYSHLEAGDSARDDPNGIPVLMHARRLTEHDHVNIECAVANQIFTPVDAAVFLVSGQDQGQRTANRIFDLVEGSTGHQHCRDRALHIGGAEAIHTIADRGRGEWVGLPFGRRITDRFGIEVTANAEAGTWSTRVDSDQQGRTLWLARAL